MWISDYRMAIETENWGIIRAHASSMVNFRDNGTPLFFFAKSPWVLRFLVENGADLSLTNEKGQSIFDIFAVQSRTELLHRCITEIPDNQWPAILAMFGITPLQEYLNAGGDPNKRVSGDTPLLFLAKTSEQAELLIRAGADVNLCNNQGKTLLHRVEETYLLNRLVHAGADINIRDNEGRTALHYVKKNYMVDSLVQAGADVNICDNEGYAPICYASDNHIRLAFLKNGVDPKTYDRQGWLPIHYVRSLSELVAFVNIGCDFNAVTSKNETLLHLADSLEIASFLIDHGADIMGRDANGRFPHQRYPATSRVLPFLRSKYDEKRRERKILEQHSDIFSAIEAGDFEAVKFFARTDADSIRLHRNIDGRTPLHLALTSSRSLAEIVELLVSKRADVNARDAEQNTPLHIAITSQQKIDVIDLLIQRGADLFAEDALGRTPLCCGVIAGNAPEVLKLFLEKGVDIEHKNSKGLTVKDYAETNEAKETLSKLYGFVHEKTIEAFFEAIEDDQSELVRSFLRNHHFLLQATDKNGDSALTAAIGYDTGIDTVLALLENEVNVNFQNAQGRTPLHLAVEKEDNEEIIDWLLESDASPTIRDKSGKSAFDYALDEEDDDLILRLAKKAPEVDLLPWALQHSTSVFFLETLCEVSTASQVRDDTLFLAIRAHASSEVLDWVLQKDEDVNSVDDDGNTPLHVAVEICEKQAVSWLLDHGADPSITDDAGCLALHLAACDGMPLEIFVLLLDRCDNINAIDDDCWTALHHAAFFEAPLEIVQKLLESGADLFATTNEGKTVLDLATRPEVKTILEGVVREIERKEAVLREREAKERKRKERIAEFRRMEPFRKESMELYERYRPVRSFGVRSKLVGHRFQVKVVEFSPDSTLLITGSSDQTAAIWDVHTGERIQILEGHTQEVVTACFSPCSRYALTGSIDNTLKLWDVAEGTVLQEFFGHEEQVVSAALSPDGRRIVSGSWDRTVKIWDISKGEPLCSTEHHRRKVTSAVFSPDGSKIATGGEDGIVYLLNGFDGSVLSGFQSKNDVEKVRNVLFTPNGEELAIHYYGENHIVFINIHSGVSVRGISGGDSPLTKFRLSTCGRFLVTGNREGHVCLWDVAQEKRLLDIEEHRFYINSVAVSPNGLFMATSDDSSDHHALLWNMHDMSSSSGIVC